MSSGVAPDCHSPLRFEISHLLMSESTSEHIIISTVTVYKENLMTAALQFQSSPIVAGSIGFCLHNCY